MTERPPEGFPERIERTPDDDIQDAMHQFPYGIYIIGTHRDGKPNGMIADWVMQVSFDPRLVAVAFENDSTSLASIRQNRAFTVNLLSQADNGMELARGFVQPRDAGKVKGRSEEHASREYDKLADIVYTTTEDGCPILEAALAWVNCEAQDFVPAGDHTLVLGRVIGGALTGEGDPLTSVYTGWIYSG